jgi:hypothetical protein
VSSAHDWRGGQFLADRWELSGVKAERVFGYRSVFSPTSARQGLGQAIAGYSNDLREWVT